MKLRIARKIVSRAAVGKSIRNYSHRQVWLAIGKSMRACGMFRRLDRIREKGAKS